MEAHSFPLFFVQQRANARLCRQPERKALRPSTVRAHDGCDLRASPAVGSGMVRARRSRIADVDRRWAYELPAFLDRADGAWVVEGVFPGAGLRACRHEARRGTAGDRIILGRSQLRFQERLFQGLAYLSRTKLH